MPKFWKREVKAQSTRNPDDIGHLRRKALALVKEIDTSTFEDFRYAANKKKPLGKRIKRFVKGESKSGRWAKVVKDFALFFLPWGQSVSSATEFITEVVAKENRSSTSQTNNKKQADMKVIKWIRDRLKEKSTKSALVVLAAGATFFGLSVDAIALSEAIDSVLVAISGVITAGTLVYEMFRKENSDEPEVL